MSLFATHSELILSLAKLTSALLIAFAVDPFLKRSALRAAFWAGVLLILPSVILATHGRGIVNILPLPSAAERVATAPAVMSPAPAAPVVMSPAPAAPVVMSPPSSAPVAIPTTQPLAAPPSEKTVSQKMPEVQKSPANWVAVVFFSGLALSLLPTLLSLLRIAFAQKKPANNETLALWESIRPQGMQTVPLYVTSSPSAPFTAGLVRTAILLPESSVDWSPRRLRSTLHHEAAHIARRDILVRMAASLVRAVLWFHPLVWLAHRKLVAAQEEACDEIALSAGIPPDEYAEDLLETAKHSQFAFAHSLHMARWSQLGYRIQTILHYKQTTQKPTNMKTIATAILGITVVTYGLSTVGFSQTPEAAQAPDRVAQTPKSAKPEEVAKKTEAQTAMEEKLKQIVIPVIDFEDTSLEEAMDFIRNVTRELDEYEKNPAKKGFNFVVKLPEGEESPHIKELRMRNVPAGEALKYICDLTGLQYKVEEFAVIIFKQAPADQTPKAEIPKEDAKKTKAQTVMEEKLKQIMIPVIDFEDTSLEEAMDFIRNVTRGQDEYEKNPAKKGINIVVKLPEDEESPHIKELRLNNVPAGEALKYICDLTGLQYKVEEFAVLISPLDSTHAKKAK